MAEFELEYTLTERVRRSTLVEAHSLEEALRLVEEYETDTSEDTEVDSLLWEISDVTGSEG